VSIDTLRTVKDIRYFSHDDNYIIFYVSSILESLVIIVSFTLCLFFFNTFDTGVLVKRTLVDRVCFLIVIIVYNTLEHYALHWISHTLHLSDALASSFISGVLVMTINPLHHKLMHFMKGKLSGHHTPVIADSV